jgi:ribosome maturation factor RimP
VNELLTNIELVSFDYTLEVSSPGLDRKFFKLGQFHEFIGHEIKIKFYDGNKKVTKIALLLNANEEGIFLKDENEFFINFDKVIVARLEPIFEVSNE